MCPDASQDQTMAILKLAKLWNALLLEIRSSDNLLQFKRNLKTHLFRKAFY